jgi:hypothetical protein
MYGNAPFRDDGSRHELSADQRKSLRRDLSSLAARTRELLPDEFVVGSEITRGTDGPQATIAVQPPVGSVVSADYTPEGDVAIGDTERDDIATGLAASAALEVKQSIPEDTSPPAQ